MRGVETYVVTPELADEPTWVALFREEGFSHDGSRAERPTEPLTLYRGAAPERRAGISWTVDRSVAMRWATSEGQRPARGRLWVIDACPPASMLAIWSRRHEAEVIIDSAGLAIRPWTEAEIKACPPMQRSADHGVAAPTRVVERGALGGYQRSAKKGARTNRRRTK